MCVCVFSNLLFSSSPQPKCGDSTTLPMYWSAWGSLPKTPTSTRQGATTSLAFTGWALTLQTSHTYVSPNLSNKYIKIIDLVTITVLPVLPLFYPCLYTYIPGVRHREDGDVLKDRRCGSKAIVAIQGRRHWCQTKHSLLNCYDIEGVFCPTGHMKDTCHTLVSSPGPLASKGPQHKTSHTCCCYTYFTRLSR